MFETSLRAVVPTLLILGLAGCADLDDNEGETGLDGVELIGEDEMENSTGTFPLDPGGAVDGVGGEATPAPMDTPTPDTAAMPATTDSIE